MISKNSVLKKIRNLKQKNFFFLNYDFWHTQLNNVEFIDYIFRNCTFTDDILNKVVFEKIQNQDNKNETMFDYDL